MASFAGLNKFLGRTVSEGAAFAAGFAVAPTLEPVVQELRNETWSKHQSLPLDPMTLAEGVSTGQVARDWATNEATLTGIAPGKFDRLVAIADTGPGAAEAFRLWRRGLLDTAGFRRALKRQGLEAEWIDALEGEHDLLLSPEVLAMGRQQGFVSDARGRTDSAKQGVPAEDADVLYELAGLPPGIGEALDMLRRSIIDVATFDQMVREGHTKTKYTEQVRALRDRVLSAATYARLHLKGWITEAQMHAGGELNGYTAADMDLLFLSEGRPISPTQGYTAWARGAPGPYGGTFDEADFEKAIAQSDIRPEYAKTLWADRFNYPSLFQLRLLAQTGALAPARVRTIMRYQRYEDQDADAMISAWTGGATSTADLHVTKAETQLWNTLHRSYVAEESDDGTAASTLGALGVPAAAIPKVLDLWQAERALIRKQLTPAQLKKAFTHTQTNPDTGQPFTRDEILAELLQRGYSMTDANVYLDQ